MESATTTDYLVSGMTCGHCELAVREEVEQVAGVTGVEVSAQSGLLRISHPEHTAPEVSAVLAAVDEAGYTAALRR